MIRIISESAFLELVGLKERQEDLRKTYPTEVVCKLLGAEMETIQRWELFRLVHSQDGQIRGPRRAEAARAKGLAPPRPFLHRPGQSEVRHRRNGRRTAGNSHHFAGRRGRSRVAARWPREL